MTAPFVRLEQIKKIYPQQTIFVEKLLLHQGQCSIITGKNGSGKTTLLKIINGLIDADSGMIYHHNQPVVAKKGHRLQKISTYLANKPYFFDGSIARNIAYPLMLKNNFRHRHNVDRVLHWANLTALQKRHPSSLSTGERQKLALARAYAFNPTIWLLDETVENLDNSNKAQVFDLLKKLLAQNRCIVISTHTVDVFSSICHQVFQMG